MPGCTGAFGKWMMPARLGRLQEVIAAGAGNQKLDRAQNRRTGPNRPRTSPIRPLPDIAQLPPRKLSALCEHNGSAGKTK